MVFIWKDDFSSIVGSATIPDLVGYFISPELYQVLTDDERNTLRERYNRYGNSAATENLFLRKSVNTHSPINYTQTYYYWSDRSNKDKNDLTSFIDGLANKYGFSVAPENSEKRPSL